MNISKSIGIATAAIPIVGILIGGITFGVNFKTDVEQAKGLLVEQQAFNVSVEERFAGLNIEPYDDALLWLQADTINERIDNIYIPDEFDDFYLDERIQNLALQVIELRTELDNLEIQDVESFDDSDLRGRLAELEGSLQAMGNIEVDGSGEIDVGPLIVSLASLEGSVDTIRTDIRNMKTDIKNNERAASSAASGSGSSRTVENRYDDSDLRSRVSAVERQVNSIPSNSNSGTTIQRVENPFDDSALRADISRLQTAIAVLQAAPDNAYDDSNIRDMIDDIQWELDNLDIPTTSDTVDVSWLENLMYDIKNELSMRIDELEWASDTTTTSDDMYAEKWLFEDLQAEVMFVQEQVWELQTLINQTSDNNNTVDNNTTTSTIAGRSYDGAWDEPYWIYVNHNESSYTGDYYMDGYWNGEAVWINWSCGNPGSQFEYCYIFKYNYVSWVIQPLEPSNDWLANAYTDGQWPWSGTWNGAVNSVEIKGQ